MPSLCVTAPCDHVHMTSATPSTAEDQATRCPIGQARDGARCVIEEIQIEDLITSSGQDGQVIAANLEAHYGAARESWPHCRTHNMIADLDLTDRVLKPAGDIRVGDILDDGLGAAAAKDIRTSKRGDGTARMVWIDWGTKAEYGYPPHCLLPIRSA